MGSHNDGVTARTLIFLYQFRIFKDIPLSHRLFAHAESFDTFKQDIRHELQLTASVGVAHNKFLAKLASDFEKPRGYSVIGISETLSVLATKPVGAIWGVGKATQALLEKSGITMISQLQTLEKNDLMRRFGNMGARLYHLSRGEDLRDVSTERETKSISAETTFNEDIGDFKKLEPILWDLSQKVSRRAKASQMAGHTISLKLKTPDFKSITRAVTFEDATNLAHRIFEAANPLLKKEVGQKSFRLIGVGISHLVEREKDDEERTLDGHAQALTKAELAIDKIRHKFGNNAVERGISFRQTKQD